tara:strand:- start:77 stop:1105 length:1029 start_codon:yes stop_codon:yes gene_type:complete
MKKRICKKCGRSFKPSIWNQVYCGSKTRKTGCSWWNVNEKRSQERWQNDGKFREYQKEYGKTWKQEQRKKDTSYAKRQREVKKRYSQSERGKEVVAKWRKNNIQKILEWNLQRLLKKRGVIGFHNREEWEALKKKHGNRCVLCGISEKDLAIVWIGTGFTKLTKDHIIPIRKGGTDYIGNIQPLCVSCNARKHVRILKDNKEIVVAVSGYFNPLHVGHIELFEEAKDLGTKLVVIVNNDHQVQMKGSYPFMNEQERMHIVSSLASVDNAVLSIDKDKTVRKTLGLIKPDIFANGGDRTKKNIPEIPICKKIKCKLVFGVGKSGKIQSSSWLLKRLLKEQGGA